MMPSSSLQSVLNQGWKSIMLVVQVQLDTEAWSCLAADPMQPARQGLDAAVLLQL
jgi:hypothetical protein